MGRLEIHLDESWGSVCSQNFGMRDGHVACRQLGFKGVISISNVNESWLVLHLFYIWIGNYIIAQDKYGQSHSIFD